MKSRSNNNNSAPRGARGGLPHLLGNLLLAAGLLLLLVAGFAYFADPSRAEQSLPRPVALASGAEAPATHVHAAAPEPTTVPSTATPRPASAPATANPAPTAAAQTQAPVQAEPPVRMVVRSIYVDSKVEEIGTAWKDGQLIWETVPFVVGHYRTSAMPGQVGNAIFAGHVTSQTLGNVFINLWEINIGDKVEIYTKDTIYTYIVSRVRLVVPTDTSVMNPTPDPTITLITCAGDWIPSEHQYSQRLIVSAKLASSSPLDFPS